MIKRHGRTCVAHADKESLRLGKSTLRVRFLRLAFCAAALTATAGTLAAEIPPSVQAPSIELEHAPVPQPKASLGAMVAEQAPATVSSGADLTLVLHSVHLEGVHAIDPAEIAPLFQPLIGKQVTIARLNALSEAITKRYRDAGFILAQASLVGGQQLDPAAADVTIRVVEGYIDQVGTNTRARPEPLGYGRPPLPWPASRGYERYVSINQKRRPSLISASPLPDSA